MHAGTEEGGADEQEPADPFDDNEEELQCEEEGGGEDDAAAASPSIDVSLDEAMDDGKPSAKAAPSGSVSAKGGDHAIKRKKAKPKHQRSQKPEGYPSRNRSSYNYFFQAQRARLLEEAKGSDAAAKVAAASGGGATGGAAEVVGFENMAKTIAKRWKQLTPEELEPFQQLARQDMARYRREMEEYQQELVRQSRREREKSAAAEASSSSRGDNSESAPYPASSSAQGDAASGPASAAFADQSPPRSAPADALSTHLNLQALLGATAQGAHVPSHVSSSQHDEALYANFVLSHLESLLQPAAGSDARAPPAHSLSAGDLNFLAASALSQMLVRQPWNPSSVSSHGATPANHQAMWNFLSIQQQQQTLQLAQHQQQQQRQLDNLASAAQLALLQQLLNPPLPGNGGVALNLDRHHVDHAPSASDSQGQGDNPSDTPRDDPSRSAPHPPRKP